MQRMRATGRFIMAATVVVLAACGSIAPTPSTQAPSAPAPGPASPTPGPLASFAVTSAPASSGSSATLPAGRLAVVVGDTNAPSLVVTVPGATAAERIVAGAGSATWSPDGRRLLATCQARPDALPSLCAIDLRDPNGASVPVLDEVAWARWAPGADLVALGRSFVDVGDTWIARPDGTGLRQLSIAGHEMVADRWSPDGTQLAGRASRGGVDAFEVAVCNVVAATCRTLGPGQALAWSPGGRLAVITGEDQPPSSVDPASGARTELTAVGRGIVALDWSATGSIAAVVSDMRLIVVPSGSQATYPMAPALRIPEPFTGSVAWSPGGGWIGFLASSSGDARTDLYVARADGSELTRVTTTGDARSFAWAPGTP